MTLIVKLAEAKKFDFFDDIARMCNVRLTYLIVRGHFLVSGLHGHILFTKCACFWREQAPLLNFIHHTYISLVYF